MGGCPLRFAVKSRFNSTAKVFLDLVQQLKF